MAPRKLAGKFRRQVARRERDGHWEFMERLQRCGILHVCLWNKYNQKERGNEMRLCLMDGMDLMSWRRAHPAWFGYGSHNRERHTFQMWLTARGRTAVRFKSKRHDLAPVFGGLVEPGYQVKPIRDFHRSLAEQINRRHRAARPGHHTKWISRPDFPRKPREEPRPVARRRRKLLEPRRAV